MTFKRRLRLLTILVVMSVAFIAVAAIRPTNAESDASWPMWRHDPAHTGFSDGTAPTNLAVKWRCSTNGPVTSSPTIVGDSVYVGSYDHNLYCVDAQNGNLRWKYAVNALILSSPAVKDGRVYVGPDDGSVYCLNANNGSLIWKTYAGGYIATDPSSWFMIRSSPAVVSGRIYVGALDKRVYCLEANSGVALWTYETGDSIFSSPAVVNGKVYIGSADRYLYALNASDGVLIWKFDCGYLDDAQGYPRHGVFSSPTVAKDLGMVCVFSNALAYYAVDAETGVLRWQYPVPRNGTFALMQWVTPTYAASKFYFQDDFLEACVDAKSGKGPLWISNVWAFGRSSAAYADGKILASGSSYRGVLALDALTGNSLSFVATGGAVRSSPSVAYGDVFVGSYEDSSVYCFTEGVPQPTKTKTAITYALSATEVMVGEPVTLKGSISPAPTSSPRVVAFFKRPDGTSVQTTATAQQDGSFEMFYKPDVDGNWTARAFWGGDDLDEGASASELPFTVVAAAVAPPPQQQIPPPPPSVPLGLYAAFAVAIAVLASELIYLHKEKAKNKSAPFLFCFLTTKY